MWLPVFGLIIGIILGIGFAFPLPAIYAEYLSIAVLAGLDSILGGWRAGLEGKFRGEILLSGFFVNAAIAALLAYLGDLLGLDLYLAAVIVFGLRIFNNISSIRRGLIERYLHRKKQQTISDNSVKDQQISPKAPER